VRALDVQTWRRITVVALWGLVVLGAAWTLVRLLGLERGYPLVPLIAYTPYAPLVAIVVLGASALLRRWAAAAACGLIAAVLVALLTPRALSGQGPDERPGGPRLTVMTANLMFGQADPEALVELTRGENVDLLSVQELTPRAVERFDAAGLGDELPHRALAPATAATGGGLFARLPLADRQVDITGSGGFSMPSARLDTPEGPPVEAMSVHPPPPTGSIEVDRWTFDLSALPRPEPPGPIRLLAGDFNATLDHAEFRDLVDSGYVDAADATGAGLIPTWPSDRVPPPVTIDHVLVDERVWVEDASVHDLPGSDHKAVIAKLVLPPVAG
jgi:endonuclease/exonuclease/phosphatase (EEP) superfamily protein YafD